MASAGKTTESTEHLADDAEAVDNVESADETDVTTPEPLEVQTKQPTKDDLVDISLTEQIAIGPELEKIQKKRRINHLAHLIVCLLFPLWLFVWCFICITDKDYDEFVKSNQPPE